MIERSVMADARARRYPFFGDQPYALAQAPPTLITGQGSKVQRAVLALRRHAVEH
jgi:hypothetical protein